MHKQSTQSICRANTKTCNNCRKSVIFLLSGEAPSHNSWRFDPQISQNATKTSKTKSTRELVLSQSKRNDYCRRICCLLTCAEHKPGKREAAEKQERPTLVTVKSSQKIFTDAEVSSLTGICVEHIHNFARSRHLGIIARAAEAAGTQAEQWLFTLSDLMVLVTLFPRCTH